jgi:hypothetical protein
VASETDRWVSLSLDRLLRADAFLADARRFAAISDESFESALAAVHAASGFLGPRRLGYELPQWHEAIAILGASGTLDSAKRIDGIRELAEDICINAESHLRIMLKKLPALELADSLPSWFEESVPGVDSRAMASASKLVRAVLADVNDIEASCEPSDDGAVEISWDTPRQLTWVVNRPRMSWPGINVRVYARVDEDRPELQVRSFFLAHRAVEHARQFLNPA